MKRSLFLDDEELPTASALPDNLSSALESSELLIVVCSPNASKSYWVDKEIVYFKHYHGEGKILAILKEGEPNATYSSVYETNQEAFPKSLRYLIDNQGNLTKTRTEPLAADARKSSLKKKALLKLIAGILKVDFADLWERDKKERRKKTFLLGMVIVSFMALSLYASLQFAGESGNKELEQLTQNIASIEYRMRHEKLSLEESFKLNRQLKKLKKDKEHKEDSLKFLGKLTTSTGKKAKKIYDKNGAKETIAFLTSTVSEATQESKLQEISKEKLTLAKLYVETYAFAKAKESYQRATEIFFDYENAMAYGIFLSKQNKIKEAIAIYEKLLNKKLVRDIDNVLTILNNLALLYNDTQRFTESEQIHKENLKIRRKLAEQNPSAYLPTLAISLGNLASLYRDTQRFSEAEKMYQECLGIHRKLAEQNPSAYLPDLAISLGNLALLYSHTQRFSEAEQMNQESLKIRRKLAEQNPSAYLPTLATSLNNLASLYSDTQRFTEAEKMYKESLGIRRKLAEQNPSAYLPDLALSLGNLASLYRDTQRFSEAEKMYQESLKIRRKLAKQNPSVYLPDLATSLNGLASLYYVTQRFNEAEKMYQESLKIRRKLAKQNSSAYLPDVANSLNNLMVLYDKENKIDRAKFYYREYLKVSKTLMQRNFQQYAVAYAELLVIGVDFYHANKQNLVEAKEILMQFQTDENARWMLNHIETIK